MTVHGLHPDIHEFGLSPGCKRCAEHAEHPLQSLDRANLLRLAAGKIYTSLDRMAAARLGLLSEELSALIDLRRLPKDRPA